MVNACTGGCESDLHQSKGVHSHFGGLAGEKDRNGRDDDGDVVENGENFGNNHLSDHSEPEGEERSESRISRLELSNSAAAVNQYIIGILYIIYYTEIK